eukprot:Gb_38574 [translate_table: standard]
MALMGTVVIIMLINIITFRVQTNAQLVPALFILGDSLVDVGNNNHLRLSLAKADFPHNGVDYAGGKATGRFSNGRNAADFLAQKLGFASTPPPYLSLQDRGKNNSILNGVDFASGGAGILEDTGARLVQRLSLNTQMEYLATVYGNLVGQLGSPAAEKIVSKSLFVVVIGSNDLLGYFKSESKLPSKYTPQQYIDLLVSTLKGHLEKLYNLGARKMAYVGVGPLGCSPSQRSQNSKTGACVDEVNDIAMKFNAGVGSLLSELSSSLQGLKYAFCNTYGLVYNYIQNPQNYGFKDVTDACCGAGKMKARVGCLPVVSYCPNRREYVFWDMYHPTEIVSEMLTDSFFNGSANEISPINIKQLIAI